MKLDETKIFEKILIKLEKFEKFNLIEEVLLLKVINHLSNEQKLYICDMIIRSFLNDKKIVSKILLTKLMTIYPILNNSLISSIAVKKLDVITRAEVQGYDMLISKMIIDEFYRGTSKFDKRNKFTIRLNFLSTIYHELCHISQLDEMINCIYSKKNIVLTKELILINDDYPFYINNYRILFREREANLEGLMKVNKYTSEKSFSEEELIREKNDILSCYIDMDDCIRCIKDDLVDYDIYLEDLILNKPELLEIYKVLNLEYVIDDNTLRRRTKEEINKYLEDKVYTDDLLEYLHKTIDKIENYARIMTTFVESVERKK